MGGEWSERIVVRIDPAMNGVADRLVVEGIVSALAVDANGDVLATLRGRQL